MQSVCKLSAALRGEHARHHWCFHCHAKVRAYARCGAIRQSVGHNRPDSRHGTKYANSTDVGNGPTKTINASDCMCSYIDGSIKISAWTRFESGGTESFGREAKRKGKTPYGCEWLHYFATTKLSIRCILHGFIARKSARYRTCFLHSRPGYFLRMRNVTLPLLMEKEGWNVRKIYFSNFIAISCHFEYIASTSGKYHH